jgi:diguanylate cyclase (GGDEF)-like protein
MTQPEALAPPLPGTATLSPTRDTAEARRDFAAATVHESARHPALRSPGSFLERLHQAVSSGASPLALLIIDIDRFHGINRAHGFTVGDRFLRDAGRRLAEQLRADDLITRLGGDEFAVLLFDVCDGASGIAVARQVLAGLKAPFPLSGAMCTASARGGLALCPTHGSDVRALLYAARSALRSAKETGVDVAVAERDVVAAPAPPFAGSPHDAPLTGRDIRDGLLRSEFRVHFQPIHNFVTHQVDTLEALVRWRHPTRGLLGPASFLPVAERSGLAHVISVRVLDSACYNLRRWRSRGHAQMRVAVNLSAQDFRRDDFAGTVAAALERHSLPPSSLELELTEHEQLDDERAVGQVAELAQHGVALTIDDFGVKYSSLRNLHRLPVRALKVDRSFVRDLGQSKASTSIVSAVVSIASQMGLRLVAEGVEQMRQMDELRRLGCNIMQGFLFSPAVPADDVAGYLDRAEMAA